MKKQAFIILISLSITFAPDSFGQNWQQIWKIQNQWGPDHNQTYSKILLSPGGNIYLIGNKTKIGDRNDSRLLIVKLKINGNIEWEKEYDLKINPTAATLSSNRIIVAGQEVRYNSRTFIISVDTFGTEPLIRSFDGKTQGVVNKLLPTYNSRIIALGNCKEKNTQPNGMWIGMLDKDLRILTERYYGLEWDELVDGIITNDGHIFILGTTYKRGNGKLDVYMAFLDKYLNITWDRFIGVATTEGDESSVAVVPSIDNLGYSILCNRKDNSDGQPAKMELFEVNELEYKQWAVQIVDIYPSFLKKYDKGYFIIRNKRPSPNSSEIMFFDSTGKKKGESMQTTFYPTDIVEYNDELIMLDCNSTETRVLKFFK